MAIDPQAGARTLATRNRTSQKCRSSSPVRVMVLENGLQLATYETLMHPGLGRRFTSPRAAPDS